MLRFIAWWNMHVDKSAAKFSDFLFYSKRFACLILIIIEYYSKIIAYLGNHPNKMFLSFAELLKYSKWQLHSMIKSSFFTILVIGSPHSPWVLCSGVSLLSDPQGAVNCHWIICSSPLLISVEYRFSPTQSFAIFSEKKKEKVHSWVISGWEWILESY